MGFKSCSPVSALLENGGKSGVLQVAEGRARFRPVETDAADGSRVIARKGIVAGDVIVAKPAGVKPGARVQPAAKPG